MSTVNKNSKAKASNNQNYSSMQFKQPNAVGKDGMFPTTLDGKLISNRCHGIDSKAMSFEKYKKSDVDKLALKKMKSSYKVIISAYYGDGWMHKRPKIYNVPSRINKATMMYEIVY